MLINAIMERRQKLTIFCPVNGADALVAFPAAFPVEFPEPVSVPFPAAAPVALFPPPAPPMVSRVVVVVVVISSSVGYRQRPDSSQIVSLVETSYCGELLS